MIFERRKNFDKFLEQEEKNNEKVEQGKEKLLCSWERKNNFIEYKVEENIQRAKIDKNCLHIMNQFYMTRQYLNEFYKARINKQKYGLVIIKHKIYITVRKC